MHELDSLRQTTLEALATATRGAGEGGVGRNGRSKKRIGKKESGQPRATRKKAKRNADGEGDPDSGVDWDALAADGPWKGLWGMEGPGGLGNFEDDVGYNFEEGEHFSGLMAVPGGAMLQALDDAMQGKGHEVPIESNAGGETVGAKSAGAAEDEGGGGAPA